MGAFFFFFFSFFFFLQVKGGRYWESSSSLCSRMESIDAPAPRVLLALPGPLFNYRFLEGEFTVSNHPIIIHEESHQGSNFDGTGFYVWDAAIVLVKYLERCVETHELNLQGKRVVELGAGTGIVGISAAVLGAQVILSDLDNVVELMRRNVAANEDIIQRSNGSVMVEALDWFSGIKDSSNVACHCPVDIVLASDVVFGLEYIPSFVSTLLSLLSPGGVAFISHKTRSMRIDEEFQRVLFANGLVWNKVPSSYLLTNEIDIYEIKIQ